MLIAGNWKMNGLRAESHALASALREKVSEGDSLAEVLICPPFTMISEIAEIIQGTEISLGAQDCHVADAGAHTGDVSATMLRDIGCQYVILGHSERRADHADTSLLVRAKAESAHKAGLKTIICVGETLEQRKAGDTLDIITTQLEESLPDSVDSSNTVIAYEPVWAIGSGEVPTVEQISEVHSSILSHKKCAGVISGVLYGGSVKPENAEEILAIDGVGGALVGGASLDADSFFAIAQAAG